MSLARLTAWFVEPVAGAEERRGGGPALATPGLGEQAAERTGEARGGTVAGRGAPVDGGRAAAGRDPAAGGGEAPELAGVGSGEAAASEEAGGPGTRRALRPGSSRDRAAARSPGGRVGAVAVLAGPAEAAPLGASVALRLTGATAVLATWTGHDPAALPSPPVLATPAARRLAAGLRGRDLAAVATGRLVVVALPAGEEEAAAVADRLDAAVGATPVVLAVGGPRGATWDALLVARDLVLVHARDGALTELTVARLGEQGATAAALDGPPRGLARAFARSGLALPGALPRLDGVLAEAGR